MWRRKQLDNMYKGRKVLDLFRGAIHSEQFGSSKGEYGKQNIQRYIKAKM